ncbi:MAG TPA: orotidine-5'-phosphate decarboxylase [Candidatus Paceibacterota bacterium]|nr:orotidine-5'-phosphate decarboxylase [Candidatus Paceibacterota bacterium]
MISRDNVIVALDGMTETEALKFAKLLAGKIWGFKINDLLFSDIDLIRKLKPYGRVFADAKLHDIPNTVANGVRRLAEAGADIITVHASGGIEMMKAACRNSKPAKIVAVTVLTSAPDNKKVTQLVRDAAAAGVGGIVCSGRDLAIIQQIPAARSLLKVVPGVRPDGYAKKDDQKRIVTPAYARASGADFIVIGRPIIAASDPEAALAALDWEE